jgi:hypothetical protein
MTKRWDVCSARPKKDGTTFWHRVGTAFEGAKGIGVVFDSLPLPDKEGRVSVQLFEPREKGATYQPPARTAPKPSTSDDMDDFIPFR